jgi:hypothetical protein
MPRVKELRGSRADHKRLMTARLVLLLLVFLALMYRNPNFLSDLLVAAK